MRVRGYICLNLLAVFRYRVNPMNIDDEMQVLRQNNPQKKARNPGALRRAFNLVLLERQVGRTGK